MTIRHTYKAYSKDGCNSADELAARTFTTPPWIPAFAGMTVGGAV